MRPLTKRLLPRPSGRASRKAAGPRAVRPRRGFSLVEVIVAIMMLAIGVLALVSSSTVVLRQMTTSSQRANATSVANQRLERLRNERLCASIVNGTGSVWGMTESWTVSEVVRNAGQRAMTVRYKVVFPKGRGADTLSVITNIPCNTV